MKDDCIIVLGSGSNKIPDIKVKEIYSSNGSAELGALYKKKYSDVTHTCVISARSFLKLDHVKPRVVRANPDKILIRDFEEITYNLVKNLFDQSVEFTKFTRLEQFSFQKNFFNSGILDLLKAEAFYEDNILKKIIHFYKFYFSNNFLGVSSGFYSILYAIKKHPDKKIIVSGISFEGGSHYYSSGMMSLNRGRVDNYLIKNLKSNIKSKIFVLDKNLSNKFGLNYLDLKLLI